MPPVKKAAVFHIRENSFIARIAALKLRSKRVAMVLGKTIHLHNTSASEFLANERWVRHELAHIRQFRQYGFFSFLVRYLVESVRSGYYRNRFEAEAREAENDPTVAEGLVIASRKGSGSGSS